MTAENKIENIKQSLQDEAFGLTVDLAVEDVVELLGRMEVVKRIVREYEAFLKESAVEWIEQNGDIPVPGTETRWYAGVAKTTKCRNVPEALKQAFDACEGDLDELAGYLASNPMKHGAVRGLLGNDVWETLFEVEERATIKEGKAKRPKKALLKATRFSNQPTQLAKESSHDATRNQI